MVNAPAPTPYIMDAVHAGGTQVPTDTTPPSERWRVVPNRKKRRQMVKRAKVARHG